MLPIKKLHPDAKIPCYALPQDAGMDLLSCEDLLIPSQERKLVGTGIAMAIPKGFVGLIWDKSGIAAKQGVTTLGGVIDSSYRGEIKVVLHNLSPEPFVVEKGMKIAQLLIQPVQQLVIQEAEELDVTQRNEGGFGSTGKF